MPIDKINPTLPLEARRPLSEAVKRQDWGARSVSADPYNLELKTVLQRSPLAKNDGPSESCPPCNETNNSCGGVCSNNCSGNANCS